MENGDGNEVHQPTTEVWGALLVLPVGSETRPMPAANDFSVLLALKR